MPDKSDGMVGRIFHKCQVLSELVSHRLSGTVLEESKYSNQQAGCVLAGILSSMDKPAEGARTYGWDEACKDAYLGAETMMKEREKRIPPPRLGTGRTSSKSIR